MNVVVALRGAIQCRCQQESSNVRVYCGFWLAERASRRISCVAWASVFPLRAESPNPEDFAEEEREFNRYTLLGEYDALFMALLRQRMFQDELEPEEVEGQFRAHLNRGISLLQQRVRNVSDLAALVPAPTQRSGKTKS